MGTKDALASADVLVVGGGLAALTATLAAREAGRSVAVLSAAVVGRSGNTLMASGGIAGATREPENSPERFEEDLARSGKGLSDPALIRVLAADAPDMLDRLAAYGVPLKRENGNFVRRLAPGHSVARGVPVDSAGHPFTIRGGAFMAAPLARLGEMGVPLCGSARVARIVRDEAGVAGVMAFDKDLGACRFFSSRRVILATGGYGGLFARTNNVSGSHGDGAALALMAGADLRDMEMVQFFPTMMFEPVKMTITNTLFGAGAVLRNADGERFLSRYDPAGDLATRDSMARAIFLEIKAGKGIDGCIHIDCSGIPEDVLEADFGHYRAQLAKYGLDMRRDMLKGTPCTHYTLGGVRIDVDGRTNVPGLYAAGEVTGGVHGVNRLGGAALMEVAVFGHRSGLAAATDALPAGPDTLPNLPDCSGYGPEKDRDAAMKTLRNLMWDHVSLARDAGGLALAQEGIARLREEETARTGGKDSFFGGTLLVAEAVVAGAMARTESRGAHYRTDYPATDPAFAKPLVCGLHEGRVCVGAA